MAVELRVVACGHDGEGWDDGVKGQAQRLMAGAATGKGQPPSPAVGEGRGGGEFAAQVRDRRAMGERSRFISLGGDLVTHFSLRGSSV